MQTILEIKLNPFGDLGNTGELKKAEVERTIEHETDEEIEDAYNKYLDFCGYLDFPSNNQYNPCGINKFFLKDVDVFLAPKKIDLLLQKIIFNIENNNARNFNLGFFVSKLLSNSYDHGFNDFVLSTRNFMLQDVHGINYRTASIRINGRMGDDFLFGSRYSFVNVKGDIGNYFAKDCNDSIITVKGNIGNSGATYCYNSIITVFGKTQGDFGLHSKKNIFRTDNLETYFDWNRTVPRRNTIQLIDKDENILQEKRKWLF